MWTFYGPEGVQKIMSTGVGPHLLEDINVHTNVDTTGIFGPGGRGAGSKDGLYWSGANWLPTSIMTTDSVQTVNKSFGNGSAFSINGSAGQPSTFTTNAFTTTSLGGPSTAPTPPKGGTAGVNRDSDTSIATTDFVEDFPRCLVFRNGGTQGLSNGATITLNTASYGLVDSGAYFNLSGSSTLSTNLSGVYLVAAQVTFAAGSATRAGTYRGAAIQRVQRNGVETGGYSALVNVSNGASSGSASTFNGALTLNLFGTVRLFGSLTGTTVTNGIRLKGLHDGGGTRNIVHNSSSTTLSMIRIAKA